MSEFNSNDELEHLNVIEGDALDVLTDLPENSVHAVVCDPPYNYDDGFMQQEWDDIGDEREYQEWCREWAEAALKPLKPGGHLIAFSGNTTHHRLFSGIEDAGYEIRDTITWHYGEGFPKGPQLSTWLDGEDAEQWGDWRGMLKPASEFAVLARAPFSGSSTKNQVEHGTANLNVEAARLPLAENEEAYEGREMSDADTGNVLEGSRSGELNEQSSGLGEEGRYPPNVALDSVMAQVMDLQSGECGGPQSKNENTQYEQDDTLFFKGGRDGDNSYDDSGGASRFFYCSKASKSERTHDGAVENDHTTVKPIDLMEWLIKLVTAEDQLVVDPFAGSGTTLLAADNVERRAVGIEMSSGFIEIIENRLAAHIEEVEPK